MAVLIVTAVETSNLTIDEMFGSETEVLGEILPICRSVYHTAHMTWPGLERGTPRWESFDYPPDLRQANTHP
jgi:hypothetical protein